MQHLGQANFDLINRVFCKLDDKVNAKGPSLLLEEEKAVYFIWAALGILGNGSFSYFFENGMDTEATASSLEKLGLPRSAECFRLAESLLPAEYFAADWEQQRAMLAAQESALDILASVVSNK
jgi:hypothetical protein